ncbi:MAG TPA: hypothetical protein VFR99_02035 [Marmoricola sp.]|nr:hypothetical protein [Marmoricola sp.]
MTDVSDWPAPDGPLAGLAVLLPGKNYPTTMPLLRGRQLLVGGSADPTWNLATARSIGADVVELEGADHAMFVDDAVRTAELHLEVTRAVDAWLTATPGPAGSS